MKTKIILTTIIFISLCSNAKSQTLAAGVYHSLSVCTDSTVQAFGRNNYGQLGNGTNTNSGTPVQLSSLTGITAVAAGNYHSLALKSDGTVWSWGYNSNGRLGDGTTTDRNAPVQVNSLTNVMAIAGGESHSIALKGDSTVWVWGNGTRGQLGNGTSVISNVPVQVTALSGIIAVAAGEDHSLALRKDGTVWAWGATAVNSYGQLGNGINTGSNVPVQVSVLTNIIAIAASEGHHSLAVKNDGTVWAWGYNNKGQLGVGTTSNSNVPVQVSSLTNIISVAGGELYSLALKNDGTVWAFGNNGSGQFGTGSTVNSSTPVQMNSLANIIGISAGTSHTFVNKSDGTGWTAGSNTYGQLGDGTTTPGYVHAQPTALCGLPTSPMAVNEISEQSDVSIFPNPSKGIFRIVDSNLQSSERQIEIYNVMGGIIYRSTAANTRSEIDLTNQAKGIYFIKVYNGQRIFTKKIVIE